MNSIFKKTLVFVACIFLAAAAFAQYDHYVEWRLQPKKMPAVNGNEEVRFVADFTQPIHGPWLLNPGYTTMSVNWITRANCGAAIEYREKGTEEWTRIWGTIADQIDYSKDMHTFHLKNLKPGTEYEYRLLSSQGKGYGPYNGVIIGRETYSFRTLDPKRDKFSVWVTADFHGGSRLNLDPMIECANAKNCDMYFFLGDNVEDNMQNARYYVTFGFLDDVCRIWGKSKPTVYLRGNHDSWGLERYKYNDYFGQPDGKIYGAIAQGPALFIYFSYYGGIGENTLDQQQVAAYLREQTAWLHELKKTDLWKKAKFRIAMAHVGTHACEDGSNSHPAFQAWAKELNDPNPEGRIQLMLCGHEHAYHRVDAMAKESKVKDISALRYMRPFESVFNYPLVVCHIVESMIIQVEPDKLVVKSYNWRKKDEPPLYDAFEVHADGSTKDLIPVQKFPLNFPAPKQKKK